MIYLNNNIYAHLCPRQLKRVAVRHDLDRLAVDRNGFAVYNFHVGLEDPEHRIILEKV